MIDRIDKPIVKQLILDGKHMIGRRALRYDDLQYDTLNTVMIMDNYDSKEIYKGSNWSSIYYRYEDIIHHALELEFRRLLNRV